MTMRKDDWIKLIKENWIKLTKDRELLKIASNFSIAGAVLVTAVTIAGKDLSPVVNNTTESGTPSAIEVRVVDLPKLEVSEIGQIGELQTVKVDITDVPQLDVWDRTPRLIRP
jgi:hypothetical protein